MPFDNKGKLNLGTLELLPFPKFDGNQLAKLGLTLGIL